MLGASLLRYRKVARKSSGSAKALRSIEDFQRAPFEIHFGNQVEQRSLSLGIVENDSQGISLAGLNGADAVTKVGSVVAACASNGSMIN